MDQFAIYWINMNLNNLHRTVYVFVCLPNGKQNLNLLGIAKEERTMTYNIIAE